MDRRQFVAWSGTGLTVGLAGCSRLDSETREGVVLTHVELGNASPEPRVFDVLVTHDGDVVHWEAREVGARVSDDELGGEMIEVDGPDEPGDVEVFVRVGAEWERTDFDSERYDGGRVIVTATYGLPEGGVLRLSRVESDRPSSQTE